MKYASLCLLFSFFLFPSCTPEEDLTCTITSVDLSLRPNCGWNLKNQPDRTAPMFVAFDGQFNQNVDGFTFDWTAGSGRELGNYFAVIITFQDLPLEVTVTEVATGCIQDLSIDESYWP